MTGSHGVSLPLPLPLPPPDEPFGLLGQWLETAETSVRHPRAACLATVRADASADARVVLVHDVADGALVVATDERSPKAAQLRAQPGAALVFHWRPLDAQVRIRGRVALADDATADATFAERPLRSRAVAWASRQSAPLAGSTLDAQVDAVDERFADVDPIPRPPTWRAYRLVADEVELWRAGARRLHRRVLWTRRAERWSATLLSP